MKISEIKSTTSSSKLGKKKAEAASGFGNLISANEVNSSAVEEAQTVNTPAISLDTLNILSNIGDESYAKKQNIDWGRDVLTHLEGVRDALILGRVPLEVLQGLEEKLENLPYAVEDNNLQDIIGDIRLRAAVELAKMEKLYGVKRN